MHATSLDASNRTFHFCNLKEVDRPVSSLPRPPSAFDPFCSLPRVARFRGAVQRLDHSWKRGISRSLYSNISFYDDSKHECVRLVRLASSNLCHSKFSTLHIINRTREFFSADTFFYTSPLVSRVFPALFANEMNFLMQLFVLKFMIRIIWFCRVTVFFSWNNFACKLWIKRKPSFPIPVSSFFFSFFF